MIGYRATGVLFLLTVLITSFLYGRGPAVTGAILSAAIWDWFFIPPRFTLTISQVEDAMMLIVYLITALLTGQLSARVQRQRKLINLREERTALLYDFAKELSEVNSVDEVAEVSRRRIESQIIGKVCLLLRVRKNEQRFGEVEWSEREFAVMEWVLKNNQAAGRGTDTLPGSKGLYLPLSTPKAGVLGVVGIQLEKKPIPSDMRALLNALCHQAEVALEREVLHERTREHLVTEKSEELYRALMDSVSHELKTPLVSICGASSALLSPEVRNRPEAVETLAQQISTSADRLRILVENLLDMTRIESGHLTIRRDIVEINEVIATALEKRRESLKEHELTLHLSKEMLLTKGDYTLLEQAISNILDNAARYTPKESKILISSEGKSENVIITVEDNGPGIPVDDPNRIFDKFFRVNPKRTGGTGLGLAITKAFIELHGGSINVVNIAPHGTRFSIFIPRFHLESKNLLQ